jgi:hypothetical protein
VVRKPGVAGFIIAINVAGKLLSEEKESDEMEEVK